MQSKTVFEAAAQRPRPDIKTRTELDRLKAQRAKPAPQMQLTPNGPLRRVVHDTERQKKNARIAKLTARLSAEKGRPTRDFAQSR